MTKALVSVIGGALLAVSNITLLWHFVKHVVTRHCFSLSKGIFLRLVVAGVVIVTWLRYFRAEIFPFLLSFSVSYFLLVWFWEHYLWRKDDDDGRTL